MPERQFYYCAQCGAMYFDLKYPNFRLVCTSGTHKPDWGLEPLDMRAAMVHEERLKLVE